MSYRNAVKHPQSQAPLGRTTRAGIARLHGTLPVLPAPEVTA